MFEEYDDIENDVYSDSEEALDNLSGAEQGFMQGYNAA